MTHVDCILLDTLTEMGGTAPSKFRLALDANVDPKHARARIDELVRAGVLEVFRGPRGAHVIVRKSHVS